MYTEGIVLKPVGEVKIITNKSDEKFTQQAQDPSNTPDAETQQSPSRNSPPSDPHTPENLENFPGADEHTETSDLQAGVGNSRYFF